MPELNSPPQRGVRSFVIREGRMTEAQSRALEEWLPMYGVPAGQTVEPAVLFGRVAPCHLEIGCGNGEAILAMAQAHPENDYLGIEVHRPGIGALLLRAHALGLRNLRIVAGDAAEVVATRLPYHAFECIYVFFPDPWPKKRHHKRRLLKPPFLAQLAAKLCTHGRLFIATDWEEYAGDILEAAARTPSLANLAGPGGRAPRLGRRPLTRYERRALRLAHPIFDFIFTQA
jgi:tRNA (guanine-N7-)-methyltransferase